MKLNGQACRKRRVGDKGAKVLVNKANLVHNLFLIYL
jgi:hypothetical protein